MIKLFYAVGTCSLASHIDLEDAGAEYSTVRIRARRALTHSWTGNLGSWLRGDPPGALWLSVRGTREGARATALRHQLWLATDRAYKAASQALAAKKAVFSQFSSGQPFDDFAAAPALQSIGPWAKLDFDPRLWNTV